MRKLAIGAALLLSTAGLVTAFAGTASAFPTKTTPCVSCHSGANVPVTATQTANNGTTATYSLSAPTATAIAVFNGSTKLATFTATSGSVSVPVGGSYTVYAVKGPTTSDGIGSTVVSPAAPPAPTDTTAPVTTSNAVATYVSSAAITLSATDNAGGSGVAATYYRLDGAAQVAGTSVSTTALGSHTLVFWSVDVAGNTEAAKTVTFAVTAPAPVDTTAPVTTSNAVATYVSSAVITLSATDNAGGSGVATTYYRLDGAAQVAGTSVSTTALGSHTLAFWSVDVAGNTEAAKTVTFDVAAPAPVPDLSAPVTTSNAVASYAGTATIRLTATDNAGGSGVAGTFYILDGGAQTAGSMVSVDTTGTHTLEFWSTDVAGNAEAHKTVSFSVSAPAPAGTKVPCRLSIHASARARLRHSFVLSGYLTPGSGNESLVLWVKRPGTRRWIAVSAIATHVGADGRVSWSFRYKGTRRGTYQFQVRFAGNDGLFAGRSGVAAVRVR